MNKFILLTLGERVGLYDFTRHIILMTDAENIEEFADEYARTFYSGEAEKQGSWYTFHGGEVAVWVRDVKVLSPAEAGFLDNFIKF